jgi:hypothetical protein
VLQEKLRTARAPGRAGYDITAHQQAAMPEQLLAPHQEKEKPRPAVDLRALRADMEMEAMELTAEQLQRISERFTTAADRARATMRQHADPDDAPAPPPAPAVTSVRTTRTSPARTPGTIPAEARLVRIGCGAHRDDPRSAGPQWWLAPSCVAS